MPQQMPGERFQIAAQGQSVVAEPRGFPELGKQTWESREATVGGAHRTEYKRGVSCTGRKQRSKEGPL